MRQGGLPGNDDDGKKMPARLDRGKIRIDMRNSVKYLKSHRLCTGKSGATGFCFGIINDLAVALEPDPNAEVPYYGRAPKSESVAKIRAPMPIHYAENDPGVSGTRSAYEATLRANKVRYEMYSYPGTRQDFHNNSTLRYNESAAKLAWERTVAFFKKSLS